MKLLHYIHHVWNILHVFALNLLVGDRFEIASFPLFYVRATVIYGGIVYAIKSIQS